MNLLYLLLGYFTVMAGAVSGQITYRSLPEFPAFKLISAEGKLFTSTEVQKKNKPTVVVYFSPTCHHCQTQTADITANMKQFKDVQFLFVTPYPESDTRPFLSDYAIEKFTNIRFGYDTSYAMARFFELQSLPGVFIYSKEGKFAKAFDTNIKPEILKETLNSIEK
jgi:cytochrome oxidase Cu insertion factor (SCO1/SenC/PrrC family)